jgi:hypothetical protein
VKADLKPASAKAWAMLQKLEALAERGIDGERLAADRKLKRLKARFDFGGSAPAGTPDLFRGTFRRSSKAKRICSFSQDEVDVANSVKWAIETASGIHCLYRDRDLMAEATPATANRLAGIAEHIALSFRTLIAQFCAVDGVSVTDRRAFIMGLYDGMMNDPRDAGQPLPSRPRSKKRARAKKPAVSPATDLHIHPYTVAFGLGRQIRFAVPLQEIAAELEGVTRKRLGQPTSS